MSNTQEYIDDVLHISDEVDKDGDVIVGLPQVFVDADEAREISKRFIELAQKIERTLRERQEAARRLTEDDVRQGSILYFQGDPRLVVSFQGRAWFISQTAGYVGAHCAWDARLEHARELEYTTTPEAA